VTDAVPDFVPNIGTPDQRVRVFVSSTLGEMAGERDAARTAINTLRLTPVMFELGARPHPSGDLYRPFLAQSQVFVGLYWQSYGWIDPDESISGIDDEWRLSGGLPRLIYVKEPAPERDQQLAEMLDRIRSDGDVSYKQFRSSGELAEMLVDDLALLLSERFEGLSASRMSDTSPIRLPTGTVTFLISDLADSTGLLERHGDGYVELLKTYRGLVGSVVAAGGGVVVESEGDGLLSAFPEANPAVRAAVEIASRMPGQGWPGNEPVQTRIGVHTGSVQVLGKGYVGIELHRAFRIASAANAGQILLSTATRELVETSVVNEGWRTLDLGAYGLKGLSHTEKIIQLWAPGLPERYPPLRARSAQNIHLPVQLTSLIGRESDVKEVIGTLARSDVRLVSLTGPGGIGKTRLAVAAGAESAPDYPDGVYFVALASVTDPDMVMPAVAAAVGVPSEGPVNAFDLAVDFLAPRRALLIMDNFEQVTAAGPRVVELLARCPGVEMLVTTRLALRVKGEHEYPVLPLDLPGRYGAEDSASVRLFAERARAVRPDFELTPENVGEVASICRALDGLPLAIELAAARTRFFQPVALLERLTRRLDLLTGGPTDAPDRHRTLRAAIQWSIELLTPTENRLFTRLGVFPEGASFEAVQEVCASDLGDAVALLEVLADQSLVRIGSGPDGEPRVGMLATLAEFARETLEASGELMETRERHAQFYRSFATRIGPRLLGSDQKRALSICDPEFTNLKAASVWFIDNSRFDELMDLTIGIWPFLWLRGHTRESSHWLSRVRVEQIESGVARGWYLALMGGGAMEMGNYDPALALTTAAIFEFAETDDKTGLAWAHLMRAGSLPAFEFGAEINTIVGHVTDAVELFRSTGDAWGEAYGYSYLSSAAILQGRISDGLEYLQRCLDLSLTLQSDALVGQAHTFLAFGQMIGGDLGAARRSLREALAVLRSGDLLEGLAYCLEMLSGLLLAEGEQTQAATIYGAADQIRDLIGLKPWAMIQAFVDNLAVTAESTPENQAALAAGRQMSLEAAIFLADDLLEGPED
jgi:predicted ATPase/class 3 adenylate cyclase